MLDVLLPAIPVGRIDLGHTAQYRTPIKGKKWLGETTAEMLDAGAS